MKAPASIVVAGLLVALAASPARADSNGGAAYGAPIATPRARTNPVLQLFSVDPALLTPGQAPSVTFQIKGRAAAIRLRLVVTSAANTAPAQTIDLGHSRLNVKQTLTLTQLASASLPEGQLSIRIAGRDSAGRLLRPAAHLSRVAAIEVRAHAFPLRGVFSYGGPDARFGATRDGHTHQGQDLLADEGTPVVAPHAGMVEYVQYQPSGAGWYVVLHGDGDDFDYAFMHLEQGSIPVATGEHVDEGQRIGSVGHTGDATANHLHFELWQGAWWAGGQPIDPLPYLQQWQQWSPVRAT